MAPKVVTKHSATGFPPPTFASNPAAPPVGAPFTLSWTIPGFKQRQYSNVKIVCVPNGSTGPGFPDDGQDVSAQSQVDGSGTASGSLSVTVKAADSFIFTLSVQSPGPQFPPFSKPLPVTAGGDASTQFQFTANGQTKWIDQTAWHNWFDQNIPTVLSGVNAKIQAQIVDWVTQENQALGVTSTDPTSDEANIKAAILKTTGKAVTAFSAVGLSTPSQIAAKAQSDFAAASAIVNQGRDVPDNCLNGLAQVDAAFKAGLSAINDFQAALELGGARLITTIQVAQWVTTAILVVASGGAATPLVAGDIPMLESALGSVATGAAIGGGTEAVTALGKMIINCAGGESVTGEQIKDACFDTLKGAVLGAVFSGMSGGAKDLSKDLGESLLGHEPSEEELTQIEQGVEKTLDFLADKLKELASEKEKSEFMNEAGSQVGQNLEANLPADMQAAIEKQKTAS